MSLPKLLPDKTAFMPSQKESSSAQVDKFSEALTAARQMQQDWLQYGINFLHIYVEDVDGDWWESWGSDEISDSNLLDTVKEFLISEDEVAVKIRQALTHRDNGEDPLASPKSSTLFDLALDLVECLLIESDLTRLSAVKKLLAGITQNDIQLLNLSSYLIEKLLYKNYANTSDAATSAKR